MTMRFRATLVWLLMLALPMHAVAGATMALCQLTHVGAAHGITAPAALAGHDRAHPHAAAPPMHAEHHHHSLPAHGAMERAQPPHHPDPTPAAAGTALSAEVGKMAQADQHDCSACAACCSAAAVPAALPGVPGAEAAATAFFAVVPAVEKFGAAGPERPPRTSLV
jgi:hypothetical protein